MSVSLLKYANPTLRRNLGRCLRCQVASISTSKKSKDTLAYPEDLFPKKPPAPPKTVEEFAETKNPKSWVSYGYDEINYENDRHLHKLTNFGMLTILVCGATFILAYAPDSKDADWYAREAYLELHRREKLGLPLIDKNLVDTEKIELPSDDELGDTEIII
ncbi:NADH dehydrogenase [ubiquinone] 1 beta subcomplex subunit 11, mitochondrial [Parasteatoda tepidariorum]|uniref:NADH dehydrogenase [ubiquinone] 1 beta subcomplex subunit 11, mitochondrial n=1 Tax=Parasteatoda tepidariorum TaxID=114398 RepID=UPI001C71DD26|nr:NADH dehydrogenase [ubiquinone] 1 beta subcomplex subunit 11, mitochondrial [Parasteatoda tepidariorum]